MAAVIALALKDLRLLARDRVDLFFTFVFPLFIAIFFGTIFGGGGGSKMEIAVIDEDGSPGSAAFVQRLEKSEEFDVRRNVEGKDKPVRPLTRVEGEDLVRRGKVVASVVLPEGFGASSDNIFRGDPIKLEGSVDPSHKAEAGMLQGILTKYAFQGMAEMFGDPAKMRGMARKNLDDLRASTGMDPAMKSALESFLPSVERFFTDAPEGDGPAPGKPGTGLAGFEPVKIELKELTARRELPNNPYALTFPQAIVWGVLGCVVSFAISLTAERSGGTLVRLMLAPISRWQILAGKALACFLTTLAVATVVMLLGYLVFRVVPVNIPLLLVVILCIALGFVGVMMLVATVSKTAGGSSGLGRAVLLMLAMIGGGSIPVFLMPPWMRMVSSISPFKWATEALDGAIWRGLSPAEIAVPCAVLLGMGIVGFLAGTRLFQWSSQA